MESSPWESFIEKKIRQAMEEGEFDNLEGEGQPLQWDENPFEDEDKRLAHHLLKSNGFTLPWIRRRGEIQAELARAHHALSQAWTQFQERAAFWPQDPQAEASWQRAQDGFAQRLAEINQQIDNYNLMAPSEAFRLARREPAREIARLAAA